MTDQPPTPSRSSRAAAAPDVPSGPTLDDRYHRAGCPAERIESYPARRPPQGDQPAVQVTVTRCIDCGGHTVKEA